MDYSSYQQLTELQFRQGQVEATIMTLEATKAEFESVVVPDFVADDVWRESVAFVGIHAPILPISATLPGHT